MVGSFVGWAVRHCRQRLTQKTHNEIDCCVNFFNVRSCHWLDSIVLAFQIKDQHTIRFVLALCDNSLLPCATHLTMSMYLRCSGSNVWGDVRVEGPSMVYTAQKASRSGTKTGELLEGTQDTRFSLKANSYFSFAKKKPDKIGLVARLVKRGADSSFIR